MYESLHYYMNLFGLLMKYGANVLVLNIEVFKKKVFLKINSLKKKKMPANNGFQRDEIHL